MAAIRWDETRGLVIGAEPVRPVAPVVSAALAERPVVYLDKCGAAAARARSDRRRPNRKKKGRTRPRR
jgi:hypothetical protein